MHVPGLRISDSLNNLSAHIAKAFFLFSSFLQKELEEFAKEGWEYAPIFTAKFHHKERKIDFVRRRRWHRKMVSKGGQDVKVSMPPVCLLEIDGEVRINDIND